MDRRDNGKQAVSDHVLDSCTKEKMKRSVLGSCKAEVESVADEENPSPKLSQCDICLKIFGCGKALGGHRRSHFMKQQQQKKVKTRFTDNHTSKPSGDNNIRVICDFDDDDGKHICCICKKEFPTKNALFGHMRSHPERPWRGVSPPTQKNSSSPSSSYYYSSSSSFNSDSMEKNKDDHDVDDGGDRLISLYEHRRNEIDLLMCTSPSWLCKGTRGRSSIGAYQAAETLFYMSCSKYFSSHERNRVFPKKDEVPPKSAPTLIKQCKRKTFESSPSKKDKVKKIKFLFKGELNLGSTSNGVGECDGEGNRLNRCKGLSESGVEHNHDEKKMKSFDDLNGESVTPTMQDHVGPSDVKKINMDKKGKNGKKLVLNSRTKDSESEKAASQEKADWYKCAACGKSFKTFQGLGGHRSVHKEKNTVSIDEPNPSEAVAEQNNSSSSSNMNKMEDPLFNETTLADQPCQSSGVKKLNFDLNELPCANDED
ncbi:hypothetical protein LR48_Vigan10g069900 [Vigna angularis]|uniref:Zinc finger protein n=1 Tax=Phaseolus angularis TaxID=3914 RepID=A0A0L9VIR5_PHAAN|nr:Zinc finger protein [Vigna angularis]KOM54807.1 hypothetical protein LR48_Vigan10g069900 [Vigna angularis]